MTVAFAVSPCLSCKETKDRKRCSESCIDLAAYREASGLDRAAFGHGIESLAWGTCSSLCNITGGRAGKAFNGGRKPSFRPSATAE